MRVCVCVCVCVCDDARVRLSLLSIAFAHPRRLHTHRQRTATWMLASLALRGMMSVESVRLTGVGLLKGKREKERR